MAHKAEGNRIRLLAVDDDENELFLIEQTVRLSRQFRLVTRLLSAEEAVDFLLGRNPFHDRRKYPIPDLVTLDLNMPGMGGFGLLAWLKANLPERPFKIVVLTNSGFPHDEQRARALGADDFRQKPLGLASMNYLFQDLGKRWAEEQSSVVRFGFT